MMDPWSCIPLGLGFFCGDEAIEVGVRDAAIVAAKARVEVRADGDEVPQVFGVVVLGVHGQEGQDQARLVVAVRSVDEVDQFLGGEGRRGLSNGLAELGLVLVHHPVVDEVVGRHEGADADDVCSGGLHGDPGDLHFLWEVVRQVLPAHEHGVNLSQQAAQLRLQNGLQQGLGREVGVAGVQGLLQDAAPRLALDVAQDGEAH